MGSTEPDYYWGRIIDIYKSLIGAFVVLVVSVGIFGEGGLSTVVALVFLIIGIASPFAFVYYAYMDKQDLARRYSNVSTRHWITIALFMWLSSGVYALVYTLLRYVRYDTNDAGQSDTVSVGTSSSSRSESLTDSAKSSYREVSSSTAGSSTRSNSTTTSSSSSAQTSSSSNSSSQPSASKSTSSTSTETNVYDSDSTSSSSDTRVYQSGDGSDTQFCSTCGHELPTQDSPAYCPSCGSKT